MNREELAERLRVLAITNRQIVNAQPAEVVRKLLAGGATAVMLREHDLDPRALYDVALAVGEACRERGALFLVNGSVEVALAAGADGAHLNRQSIPLPKARSLAPSPFVLGYSAHNAAELSKAEEAGADYCTLSPVFFPTSKEMSYPTLGLEGLERLVRGTSLPIVALGGITVDNAHGCLTAGAVGIAAIGTLYGANDPVAAASAFRRAIPPSVE